MSEVVKSVFRQREIEKLYELKVDTDYGFGVYPQKPLTRAMTVENKGKVISDKEIGRYDIEIPMLEYGDSFFLNDIQEVVVIKNKMRSSDGSITYYVEDKIVDTENTKKSYEECKDRIEHWEYEKEKFEKLKKEFEDYKREYKYKNRFFNIRVTDK